ncbi:hypothetical protein RJ40_12650 [Methanofollis aquaemaris]|uniref:Uncharacterized protein n=1 Tax=Methanofollis aquaemaris TaxID=126734 RepID=A0A8A3S8Q1_9EURY|nr:hypothetical protein [Methanofollis aquaemaris]QSZ68283.1 hypothetical protein RJ40_12650 [Methanofollis aquaemaris]
MKIILGIKKHPILVGVGTVIIVLVIICFAVLMVEELQSPEKTEDTKETENMTLEELPEDLKDEIEHIRLYSKFGISKLELDAKNKHLVIYAFDITDEKEVSDLQGKQISNWTIQIVHDVDYEKERDQIRTELMELEKDPELQIAGFDLSTEEINVWVYERTPENQALDGKEIHGWTVHVWVALTPTETGINRC